MRETLWRWIYGKVKSCSSTQTCHSRAEKKNSSTVCIFKPTRMSKGSLSMHVARRLQDSVRDAFKVAQCLYTQPHKIYSHVHALMFGFPVYLTPVLTLFPSDKP